MIARIGQMIAYFFIAGSALTSYQRSIQHLFSETSRINLIWVRWLINGYLILLVFMIGLYFLILRHPEQFGLIILINTALVTPYMYAVTFKGITQPTLWQIHRRLDKEKLQEEIHQVENVRPLIDQEEVKGQKNNLSPERKTDIVEKTIRLMEKEKLFLKSELTLQDLADELKIPSYVVTQAINGGLNKNFYDLVNEYRVEEAKRLLLDPANRNNKILSVGMDAGFNSKTTFNTVFKKFTGFTPSDFKIQQQAELVKT
jgi:AraC-like DNA-binding protein